MAVKWGITKDTAPSDVISAPLTAEERGMQAIINNVKGNHTVL